MLTSSKKNQSSRMIFAKLVYSVKVIGFIILFLGTIWVI